MTDLAEKIKMLCNDNNLRDRLVNNAFVSAQEYSIEKMYERYFSAYIDIIGKSY